jgi:peptidoglycan/xylan/chitin deacetylase (PgdA/CDA1 family)
MEKHMTWLACGLVALVPVALGAALDRALGTVVALTLLGAGIGALYLVGTFAPNAPLFGRVARIRREPGVFALTFDDGPDPRFTPEISRRLAERGHRATFFVLGKAARGHPDVLRQVLADGHELASHGDDHSLLAFMRPSRVGAQLTATEEAVAAATGAPPAPLFRAPHGVRSLWLHRTVARRGYRLCGWTGTIFDTANPGGHTIVERAARYLRPGSALLLHDGGGERRQTVDALTGILDEAERRGLRSVRLSALVEPPLSVLGIDSLGRERRSRSFPEAGDGEALAGEREQAEAHAD